MNEFVQSHEVRRQKCQMCGQQYQPISTWTSTCQSCRETVWHDLCEDQELDPILIQQDFNFGE